MGASSKDSARYVDTQLSLEDVQAWNQIEVESQRLGSSAQWTKLEESRVVRIHGEHVTLKKASTTSFGIQVGPVRVP